MEFECEICSTLRPLIRYPTNLPDGNNLKTFWVQSCRNTIFDNVSFNVACTEERFLISFTALLLSIHKGIMMLNIRIWSSVHLWYDAMKIWHLYRNVRAKLRCKIGWNTKSRIRYPPNLPVGIDLTSVSFLKVSQMLRKFLVKHFLCK